MTHRVRAIVLDKRTEASSEIELECDNGFDSISVIESYLREIVGNRVDLDRYYELLSFTATKIEEHG
jgi:hypothetical protein